MTSLNFVKGNYDDARFYEDRSLKSKQVYKYDLVEPQKINTNYSLRIPVVKQDTNYDISNSYLAFEGKIEEANVDDLKNVNIPSKIQFTRNGVLHLFESISYLINNKDIQIITNPGLVSTVKNMLLSYDTDLLDCWDTNVIDSKGYFSVAIPFKNIFNVFDYYNQCIVQIKQEIRFTKKQTINDALQVDASLVGKVKIVLTDINWYIPHVEPSLEKSIEINKMIMSNAELAIKYVHWEYLDDLNPTISKSYSYQIPGHSGRPLFIVVAFSNYDDDITKMNDFTHCNITDISVTISGVRYPRESLALNFNENRYHRVYNMFKDFRCNYFDDSYHKQQIINKHDFRSNPVFVFDCSIYDIKLSDGGSSIAVNCTFSENIPANTRVHYLVLSERAFAYQPYTNIVKKNYS